MIKESELISIGRLLKTHGIKGELNCSFDDAVDVEKIQYIITAVDGIFVPFFISSLRPKGSGFLMKLDGIDNASQASEITSQPFYTLKSDEKEILLHEEGDEDRLYLTDLIGYCITDTNEKNIGIIRDIEDSTENVLFILESPDKRTIYIPVVEDFIIGFDHNKKTISMDLPIGLTDI